MDIPGISSNDPFSGAQSPNGTQALGRDSFMQLLVTQLQNQDPLEPVANEQFVAQLANFSSLEQLEGLNQNIVAMITLNQSNALLSQLTQSSALIGKQVSWDDPGTGASRSGQVDSVKLIDGLAYLRIGDEDVPLAFVTQIQEPSESGSDKA